LNRVDGSPGGDEDGEVGSIGSCLYCIKSGMGKLFLLKKMEAYELNLIAYNHTIYGIYERRG